MKTLIHLITVCIIANICLAQESEITANSDEIQEKFVIKLPKKVLIDRKNPFIGKKFLVHKTTGEYTPITKQFVLFESEITGPGEILIVKQSSLRLRKMVNPLKFLEKYGDDPNILVTNKNIRIIKGSEEYEKLQRLKKSVILFKDPIKIEIKESKETPQE
jgi:hypothetical protein